MKSCCIISCPVHLLPFGYNEEEESCLQFKQSLHLCLKELITQKEITRFLTDLSPGVPLYAAEILLKLKDAHPEIVLECVLPYETQAVAWSEPMRDRYFGVLEHCDKETLLQTHYTEGCEDACRRCMIERADTVLAFSPDETLLHYARKQEKTVLSITV